MSKLQTPGFVLILLSIFCGTNLGLNQNLYNDNNNLHSYIPKSYFISGKYLECNYGNCDK